MGDKHTVVEVTSEDEYTVMVLTSGEEIICAGAYGDWHEAWLESKRSPAILMQVTPVWNVGQVSVNPTQITTIRPCSSDRAENYRLTGGYSRHG